jgi:N-ethylmaleimide reductase
VLEAARAESPLVGLRISPLNGDNAMVDSDPIGLSAWLAERLERTGLDYLHVMRGDFLGQQHGDVLTPIRAGFSGVLVGNMGYRAEEANAAITAGQLDAVAFGTPFLANPDLPEHLRRGAPLQVADPSTYYTPGPAGYTDYPFLESA